MLSWQSSCYIFTKNNLYLHIWIYVFDKVREMCYKRVNKMRIFIKHVKFQQKYARESLDLLNYHRNSLIKSCILRIYMLYLNYLKNLEIIVIRNSFYLFNCHI